MVANVEEPGLHPIALGFIGDPLSIAGVDWMRGFRGLHVADPDRGWFSATADVGFPPLSKSARSTLPFISSRQSLTSLFELRGPVTAPDRAQVGSVRSWRRPKPSQSRVMVICR